MNEPKEEFPLKCGKCVKTVSYSTIQKFFTLFWLLSLIIIIFSIDLLVASIQIRAHIGYFINLISPGDGDILPSLQAVPIFCYLLLNLLLMYSLFRSLKPEKNRTNNTIMYILIIINLLFLLMLIIICIVIISHSNIEHKSLHDGIVDNMERYATNLIAKEQIDLLQIEFQCCGSKKYDEWYEIKWYDQSILDNNKNDTEGNTPFSCCSIYTLSPCIHHNIENTGKNYLYTPEFNLSISTDGCYNILRERKQTVGWNIVWKLFVYGLIQTLNLIIFRFLQTAHFNEYQFSGHSRLYTIWLCGCYRGKREKKVPSKESKSFIEAESD